MQSIKQLIVVLGLLLLAGCGTTTGLTKNGKDPVVVDLSNYKSIVVEDFSDGTEKKSLPQFAGRNFSDRISSSIRGKGFVKTVSRKPVEERSLIISGKITRYEEGNPTLRLLVGMGAGSSYFDATVVLKDSLSGEVIGEIIADRNSWGLGGAVAATQTVDQFMIETADKVATELKTKMVKMPKKG